MLDWNDLRFVLAIAREGTLAGAARRLKVDQSTVGRRLSAAEAAAGTRLFVRTPEGYQATEAGRAILRPLEALEDSALRIEETLLGHDARLAGPVRLATTDSLAVWFLLPRLSELRRLHPEIVVEFVTGNSPVDLTRREADLSLRLRKPTQEGLIARRLGVAAWGLYAAREYLDVHRLPCAGDGLVGQTVVAFSETLGGTVGARWLANHAGRATVACQVDSLLSAAAAVAAGLGIAPLPCVCGATTDGLVRVECAPVGQHELWLVVHPHVKSSGRVRAVMALLGELVQADGALLSGSTTEPEGPVV